VTNLPSTRAELVAMTDEQILAHYRETNPYISLRTAKELHRGELKFWHLGAIKRKAEREARDAERRRLPDLVSRHVSSAADQAG
jgi:hypothetical protein